MTRLEPVPFKPEGPQPLVFGVADAAPYPVAALGPLGDAVEAVQALTQAPAAIPGAIGTGRRFARRSGLWRCGDARRPAGALKLAK